MAEIKETLVVTEVLSKLEEIKAEATPNNIIAGAQIVCGTGFLPLSSPVVRDRMIAVAAIIVGALAEFDAQEEAING